MSSSINAATRQASLRRLAEERYDVIVVGGGVTGAGTALDAASRGLRVALIEAVDLGAGTSRWSSKLVHGGLRYLAKGDVAIAMESARERHHLMTAIAPHLTRPITNILPHGDLAATLATNAGIYLADGLRRAAGTPSSLLGRPRRLDASEVSHLAPHVRPGTKGISYVDGQLEDDARLVVALARTAAAHGADVVTRCSAKPRDADRVELTDELTGESFIARGQVVLATGVWSGNFTEKIHVKPSRGSHLVLRAEALGHPTAQLSAPVPGHFGRFVFSVPISGNLVLLGLTDELDLGANPLAPAVPEADEEFLLETMSAILQRPLTKADVVGRFAGLRPLVEVGDSGSSSADVSRKHLLLNESGEPIVITGGKLTTYRQMAEDAVDAVVERIGREVKPCRTTDLPLVGAANRHILTQLSASGRAPERLVRRYGTLAPGVVSLIQYDRSLAEPVAPGCPTIGAEFAYAIGHEGALEVSDLIERRTRVSFVENDLPAATEIARQLLDAAQ